MAEVAVAAAISMVKEALSFLNKRSYSHKDVLQKAENFRAFLEILVAYLKDTEGNEGGELFKTRLKHYRKIAYDIEDVLDEYMLHVSVSHEYHRHTITKEIHTLGHNARHWRAHRDILSKMEDIKRRVERFKETDSFLSAGRTGGTNSHLGESSSSGSSNQHQVHAHLDGKIVGYENHTKKLVDHLINNGDSNCVTISVVGPCGSGKTCLVKHTYESTRITGHFHSRAWVHVSRSAEPEDLLSRMSMQLCGSKEPVPSDTLRSYLRQKRYLVVLDDIWSTESWGNIKSALPDGSQGSRIIVTTQKSELASSCASSSDYVHTLTGLPQSEAWRLFCKTAFRHDNGECPLDLKECALKILKRCEGSPLAIVSVAGLLSTKPKFEYEWEQLHASLGSEIGSHSNLSSTRKILLSSYRDLPSDCKSCFLYFSNILTEDNSIERGRLVRLWVAERLVAEPRDRRKTLEENAEDYLHELVRRNLVHVTRWDRDGQVGSVRVQNLVLEIIVQKAEKENFVFVADSYTRSRPTDKVRRLLVKGGNTEFFKDTNFSTVRSLHFSRWNNNCNYFSMIQDMIRNFSMLRVLDLQGVPLDEFPTNIDCLTLLRYLSLRETNIKTIPKSIKKLWCLETLDLRQTFVSTVPKEIVQLQNLRHLFIYRYDVQNYVSFESAKGVEMANGIGGLTNLQKLSLVKPDKKSRIIEELGALTQLVKLGLVGLKTDESRKLCASVQKMKRLRTLDVSSASKDEILDLEGMSDPPRYLQRLYLKGKLEKLPGWVKFSLNSLCKIALKWSRLDTSPLEVLGELPSLMELHMVDAFTGGELVFETQCFKKLKILLIEDFRQLNTVVIQDEAMPLLQKLTFIKCDNLKMLPLGIDNLSLVEELLLYDMHKEFIDKLGKNHEDRETVNHIPLIHSFTLGQDGWMTLQNLS